MTGGGGGWQVGGGFSLRVLTLLFVVRRKMDDGPKMKHSGSERNTKLETSDIQREDVIDDGSVLWAAVNKKTCVP